MTDPGHTDAPLPSTQVPVRAAEVGGLPISRALPVSELRMVGAWCFLDHAGPVGADSGLAMRVGPHPHIGLQTFTWMVAGAVEHRDSLGNVLTILPGQVNLMTAGNGISHTEVSLPGPLHAAQLWIALPESHRHGPARFQHYPTLPIQRQGNWQLTVLAGRYDNQQAPTEVHSPLLGLELLADGPAHTTLSLDPSFEHAVLCLSQQAQVDGQTCNPDQCLYLPPGRDRLDIHTDGPTRLLLIGGQPWPETLVIWWNFVGRRTEDIVQAAHDWQAHHARFGVVEGSGLDRLDAPNTEGLRLRPFQPATKPAQP